MKILEDKLEEMDAYFAPKKESEKWLIILAIAGIITYLAFTYLLPIAQDMYKKSESTKKNLEKSIIENNTYLNSITVSGDREFYVKKFDKDIKKQKNNIVKSREKIVFIDKNLAKLSGMLFNQKSWSKFLNSITEKAIAHDVNIQYIKNNYVDNNGSFGYVLEIAVGCKGEYKGIVNFINEIEQNRLVTDIYGTQFSLDSNSSDIVADINISVWGINH